MKNKKISFWVGIIIALFLTLSYYIKISVDSGANYVVKDSLLGIIIFHSPLILALYAIIVLILVVPLIKSRLK